MTADHDLQSLLAVDIAVLPDREALDHAGLLIDVSADAQAPTGTDRALALLDEIQARSLAPDIAALVHYFRANAWETRRLGNAARDIWSWEQPEIQMPILELRRAVVHEGFGDLDGVRRCQILTNLANAFSHIGRFIEAIETWDRALVIDPAFAMASGNRGRALHHYARALYDSGQAWFMLVSAHDGLAAAVNDEAFYDSAGYEPVRDSFEDERKGIAALGDIPALREHVTSHNHSLGKSAAEKRYRSWCLRERVFINPLNDLGTPAIAAYDVLTLPSITESSPSHRPPAVIGFFNQMKQEFVSARYFYFEALNAKGVHFSDRRVLQYNTLDYPAYSMATEKMRASFRIAYSIFDKVSFFLNEYFALGHDERKVSFRSVWYEPKGSPRPLLARFSSCPNWPLRGLFWLSKDLFEEGFRNVTEPDAAALNEIRNHLEHKYLQLHMEGLGLASEQGVGAQIRHSISTDDFAARTLRLLKLVRGSLIYLSLAVHCEERLRASDGGEKKLVLSMPLDSWRDDWKQ
jgi:tetratricopeptide (TPR) repeat protein